MKTLYLDCGMGAAGDMLSAALLELIPDPDGFLTEVNALGLPGVRVTREEAVKCGVTGTHLTVTVHGQEEESLDHEHSHGHAHEHPHEHGHAHEHPHEHGHAHEHSHEHEHAHGHHGHSSLAEIGELVRSLGLPEEVRQDVLAVYGLIAQAEAKAHGTSVEQVHFHEVGALDAVADVTMTSLLMHRLAPAEVVASPVRTGFGQVRCAHGILPVPAPATASILQDVPIYSGDIQGELCTPTGAALLKHFVTRFGEMPVMRIAAIGCGCGKKDFPAANCVRAMLGEAAERTDRVCQLSCNLDDMTGEEIGFAMERLLDAGALDVWTVPIGMKKSRPGVLLSVLCPIEREEEFASCMFRHTTTLGVRTEEIRRRTLPRSIAVQETPYGPVRRKESGRRWKYEYEDAAAIARERGLSLREAAALLSEGLKDPG